MLTLTKDTQLLGKEEETDIDYFVDNLNKLVTKTEERYIPDGITLFYDNQKIIVKFNYNINMYEVAVLC